MTLTRMKTDIWRRDVPGARWFKTDLQVHTVDDHAGGNAKLPEGINGTLSSPDTLAAYARRFLQIAAGRRIQVLGLTPHSPRVGDEPDTSAVWRIVDEWNTGVDDDGTPFREKIFAVFPGFEPSLNQGSNGLHLLFLFDPEIGRANYLKAFDLIMGGVSPWSGNSLQMSSKNATEAFNELQQFHRRECPQTSDGGYEWNYITLAPHIDGDKGLLKSQKAQVLRLFRHSEIAGLELGDGKLPEDVTQNRDWLVDGMTEHHQAFFHGSDACTVDKIGSRYTWLKLANPKIEALRQAFIASESRARIAYKRGPGGDLHEICDPPDVTMNERPWLKSVSISGGASFFSQGGADGKGSRFDLSPDLTCIIGGSMTGKSTFLDGLRVYVKAELPKDDPLIQQVRARGMTGFLGGSPNVDLQCPGRDVTATLHEQWPAVFYTQNELQRLAQDADAVESILARLVASERRNIEWIEEDLESCDQELKGIATRLSCLYSEIGDAEQAYDRSKRAAHDLAAFSDAGVDTLNSVSSELQLWRETAKSGAQLSSDVGLALTSAESFERPEIGDSLVSLLSDAGASESAKDLDSRWQNTVAALRSASTEFDGAIGSIASILSTIQRLENEVRIQVDKELAARGLDGARINELQALNSQAALLPSYEAHLGETRDRLSGLERAFQGLIDGRRIIIENQRRAYERIIESVEEQFDHRITAQRVDNGRSLDLHNFILGLAQRGVTRWWNELSDENPPSSTDLLEMLDAGQLAKVGMSGAVQETFKESLTVSKRRELAAIRSRDRYSLKVKVDDDSYRPLESLSGGQRVNTLLSLLLETEDERPLVIDQPEDELDNRFLFDTMLPALKKLKGKRQIIVATHNANIVVNGDADQVIQLEATANHGQVACSGAIESAEMRDAIVRTVDGGDEAFRLRRLKYGF